MYFSFCVRYQRQLFRQKKTMFVNCTFFSIFLAFDPFDYTWFPDFCTRAGENRNTYINTSLSCYTIDETFTFGKLISKFQITTQTQNIFWKHADKFRVLLHKLNMLHTIACKAFWDAIVSKRYASLRSFTAVCHTARSNAWPIRHDSTIDVHILRWMFQFR